MILMDGSSLSRKLLAECKKRAEGLSLRLAILVVGSDPASELYVKIKKRRCEEVGIPCDIRRFPESVSEEEVIGCIDELNEDRSVTGILVQMPLPSPLASRRILDRVRLEKDVDGLNSRHLLGILLREERILPCTPKGIIRLLQEYAIPLEGKSVCVIGFSDVVGKPLATLCLNRGATVTVCHRRTKDLARHTIEADIIMTGTGVPKLIKEDMVKAGAVVVDIGISKVGSKTVGDVDFENVRRKCSYITPVPGGVGPMTVVSLIENLLLLAEEQKGPSARE